MLSLRQQVGSNKLWVARLVGYHANLAWSSWHVNSHIVERHLLLGSHHKLVARTEYLIYLGHRLRAISHSTYCLHSASLEYSAYSSHLCCHQYGRVYLAFLVWRGAEHNLLAASYLGRSGKHQYGREQWRSATRYVEAYLLYRYALLPACYAFGCLHLCALKLLRLVELCNILVGKDECFFQLFVNKSLSLGYFLVCYGELFQACLVKLLLIGYDGFVAILPDVLQHTLNDAVEL